MGKEKKRQHFVPRFYLKSFSNDTEEPYYLHCYDKPEDQVFTSSTKNIAQSKFFYDISEEQFLENTFADMERKFSDIHRKVVEAKEVAALSSEERFVMAIFLSHQHIRTRKFRDIVIQASERTLDILDEGDDNEAARKFVEAGTTEEGAKVWQAQLMSNALEGFAEILLGMDWFLFVNQTDWPLWTSDHPIAIFNPNNPEPNPERGIERRGSKIHIPLSKDVVLALYDSRTYFVSGPEQLTEKDHVDFQNKLQVEHSHRQVYSADQDFELAREIILENPEYAEMDFKDSFPDESRYE